MIYTYTSYVYFATVVSAGSPLTKSRRRFPRTEIDIEISEVDRFRTLKNDSSAFSLLSKFEKQNTGTQTRPDAERAGELNARHGKI